MRIQPDFKQEQAALASIGIVLLAAVALTLALAMCGCRSVHTATTTTTTAPDGTVTVVEHVHTDGSFTLGFSEGPGKTLVDGGLLNVSGIGR
jgi:hypothetical protein